MALTQKDQYGNTYLTKKGVWTILIAILTTTLIIIGLIGWPFKKVPAGKIGLSYGGGAFEGAQYQGTYNPGSGLIANGFYDNLYEYPTTQRNYIVSLAPDEGDKEQADEITAPDKNGVQESVELTVTFKLNTSKIRKFHEQVGLKYEAYTKAGWNKMLADNFRQPLNYAVQQKIREYTTEEIRTGANVLNQVQTAVEASLKKDIIALMGDEYFCGPNYELNSKICPNFKVSIKAVTPPQDVVASYNAQKVAQNNVLIAQNNAQAQIEKAKGEKASKDAVAEALTTSYLDYLKVKALEACAQSANCVLVANGGTDVNVNVGK